MSFYTQTLLHIKLRFAEAFAQRLSHTNTFTHSRFYYTQELLTQRSVWTEHFLYANAFTQRSFGTHKLLRTEAFQHGHTEAFTRSSFCALQNRNFISVSGINLRLTQKGRILNFSRSTPTSPNFTSGFQVRPSFRKKSCATANRIRNSPRV